MTLTQAKTRVEQLIRHNEALVKSVSLIKENDQLKNQNQVLQLQNGLSGLVGQAAWQSNLVSFNPLIETNLYAPLTLNWMMLMYMYKTHGIIQTAIDMPVLDAMRGGLEITSAELSSDEIKEVEDDFEAKGIYEIGIEAWTWGRLFGGSGLIINTGQDPEQPLNDKRILKLEFYAATRWELTAPWKPNSPSMTTPFENAAARVSEFFNFYDVRFHHSHIFTIIGKKAPHILRWQMAGWGMSEIERLIPDFNSYIKTKEVLYELLEEAKIDVYRLKGLNDQLVSALGTQTTQNRVALMNQLKQYNNAIIMDLMDEFEQKQITFSGLAEVMKENQVGVASALRMPMSKIFGLQAQGLSSNEDDIENYNALVESEVRQPMKRMWRKVFTLYFQWKYGYVPDFKLSYKPLRVLGAEEEELVTTSKQNRYQAFYDRGLITSEEFGQIAEKEKLLPISTAMSEGLLEDHPTVEMPGGEEGGGNKPGGSTNE